MMETSKVNDFIVKNADKEYAWLSEKTGVSVEGIRKRYKKLNLAPKRITSQNRDILDNPRVEKTGIETRHDDKVVINWSTKSIVTNCGEYGDILISFDKHSRIQRMYSNDYEGKGHTQSEIAREFTEFPHAKAVGIYAKLHGFTKSDLGQTDIEFELGLTPEEAVAENIQAIKRRAARLTETAKWKKVQADADKWNTFELFTIEPMIQAIKDCLPTYKERAYSNPKVVADTFGVVGVSDLHYMKLCYDAYGKVIYDKNIARDIVHKANDTMIAKALKVGNQKKWFIPIGTDNLHVDGITHMTTAGTPQARQTTGDWTVDIQSYVELVMQMVHTYAQTAPVELIVLPGNHDYQTSMMLGVLCQQVFRDSKRIKVTFRPSTPRIYVQVGRTCVIFAHGEGMSMSKWDGNIHKFYMAEAREQGVNINEIDHIVFYHGHVHTGESKPNGKVTEKDLGVIHRVSLPSLSGEDSWHKGAGYVGNRQYALIDLVSGTTGRFASVYS